MYLFKCFQDFQLNRPVDTVSVATVAEDTTKKLEETCNAQKEELLKLEGKIVEIKATCGSQITRLEEHHATEVRNLASQHQQEINAKEAEIILLRSKLVTPKITEEKDTQTDCLVMQLPSAVGALNSLIEGK